MSNQRGERERDEHQGGSGWSGPTYRGFGEVPEVLRSFNLCHSLRGLHLPGCHVFARFKMDQKKQGLLRFLDFLARLLPQLGGWSRLVNTYLHLEIRKLVGCSSATCLPGADADFLQPVAWSVDLIIAFCCLTGLHTRKTERPDEVKTGHDALVSNAVGGHDEGLTKLPSESSLMPAETIQRTTQNGAYRYSQSRPSSLRMSGGLGDDLLFSLYGGPGMPVKSSSCRPLLRSAEDI